MAKRSHGRFWQKKEWSLPWLVVDRSSRTLRLYADSEVLRHSAVKPKRTYSLQGMDVMVKENQNRPDDDYDGKARWSFDLILKEAGKKMELGCDSREARQAWIDFLLACKADDAEKENKNKGKQPSTNAAACAAASVMSPPRPPKKPAMAAPPPTPATPIADGSGKPKPYLEEEKQQQPPQQDVGVVQVNSAETVQPPSTPSSYLKKAIAAGTAIQMMVGRPAPAPPAVAVVEVKTEERKAAPALPSSTPRPTGARPSPTQSPPPPPSTPVPLQSPPTPTVLTPVPVLPPSNPNQPTPSAPSPPSVAVVAPPSPPRVLKAAAPESPPSAPLSPESPRRSSTAALVGSLLAHHAALSEASAAVGSLAWNEEYQQLLAKARSSSSVNSGIVYAAHLHTLLGQFRERSAHWARRIVEEYALPVAVKTVKPVREEAEREKMVFLVEGIGFAFAQAGEEDEEEYLQATEAEAQGSASSPPEMSISAARLADQLAYKHATHELHALNALHAATLPAGLCTPLMVTVDYLGFRLKCTATLPVYDESALVWGRDGTGQLRTTEASTALLTAVATALNLAPYSAGGTVVPLSSSVSVYASGGVQYVTGLSCVYPVDLDVKYASAHHRLEVCWQAKVFRREYLSNYHVRLSSDVYGGVERRMREERDRLNASDDDDSLADGAAEDDGDEEEKEAKAAEASRFLQEKIITRFIREFDRLVGGHTADVPSVLPTTSGAVAVYPCTGSSYLATLVDGSDLCAHLHSHGINLRYLGRVAELSKQAYVRALSSVEMIARTCKTLLAQNLRTLQRTVVSTESDPRTSPLPASSVLLLQHSLLTRLQDGAVDFLNLVLGKGEESDQFWSLLLYPDICIKYALPPSTPLTLPYLRSLHLPLLLSTLLQRCSLQVVERPYAFGGERPIDPSDFIAFTAHVKEATPLLAADGYVSKARKALMGVGGEEAVEAKEWRRFTGGMEIWLTMSGWKGKGADDPKARLDVSEGRRRLRAFTELVFAYMQAGELDKAQQHVRLAQGLAASLTYPPSFASLPPSMSPAHAGPGSFGPCAEAARLSILRMWLLMLQAGGELKAIKRPLTDEYQQAVSALNYHVGLLHPLMLSLHYALAHYHLLAPSSAGVAAASAPALTLLTHCHQFAAALFSGRKPLSCGLAALLGEGYGRWGDNEAAMRWLRVALDGMQRWVEGRGVSDADKARVNDAREKLQAQLDAIKARIAGSADKVDEHREQKEQTAHA